MDNYNQQYENNMSFQEGINNNQDIEGANIAIIGVGGGGSNAIDLMKETQIEGVTFIAVNTDIQNLRKSKADLKISLGTLGAGAKPEVGRQAAENSKKEIEKCLSGKDMIFITAGMGGGTGTGASPVIAEIAKKLDILTIAIVTKPFKFEGPTRQRNAEQGIAELKKYVDTLIVIPNDKLKDFQSQNTQVRTMFNAPNEVLNRSVRGIAEIITKEGAINIDFADVKTVMKGSGEAIIGIGETKEGEDVLVAVENAVQNPLLEKSLKGAKNVLLNIALNSEASFEDYIRITEQIREYSENPNLDIIAGLYYENDSNNVKITLVATGFEQEIKSVAENMTDQSVYGYKSSISAVDENKEDIVLPKLD